MLKEIRFLVFILNYRIAAFFSSKMCTAGFKIIRPDIKKSRSSSGRIGKNSRSFGRISGAFLVQCFGNSDTGDFIRIRIRLFFLSPDQDQSKNPDPIRKIQIRIPKKRPKTARTSKKNFIPYFSQSFLVRFLQNLIKEHHLDPFSLLKKTCT